MKNLTLSNCAAYVGLSATFLGKCTGPSFKGQNAQEESLESSLF